MKVYLLDPDGEGTVIILDVVHVTFHTTTYIYINPLNVELNPICHLLALLGAHHILHVGRMRVKGFGQQTAEKI